MNNGKAVWPKSIQETRGIDTHWVPPFTRTLPAPSLQGNTASLVAETEACHSEQDTASPAQAMSNAIVLFTEALCSSRIEGISSHIKPLCQAEAGIPADRDTDKVKDNHQALRLSSEHRGAITEEQILAYHEKIKKNEASPGKFRTLADGPSGVAGSYNPTADRISDLISDWLVLSARSDMPASVKVALSHSQFETIHPFSDGNGRTGRVLIQCQLREAGYGTLPISCAYQSQRYLYYETFKQYKYGNAEKAIEFHAKAFLSAYEARQKCEEECKAKVARWEKQMSEGQSRTDTRIAAVRWVCEHFAFPKSDFADGIGVSVRQAERILAELEAKNILEPDKNRTYYLSAVTEIAGKLKRASENAMHARHSHLPLYASIGRDFDPVENPYI